MTQETAQKAVTRHTAAIDALGLGIIAVQSVKNRGVARRVGHVMRSRQGIAMRACGKFAKGIIGIKAHRVGVC